jgi:hypothetical protein
MVFVNSNDMDSSGEPLFMLAQELVITPSQLSI